MGHHGGGEDCVVAVADISTPPQCLPFQKVQHRVDTVDAQPTSEVGGLVVLVTGALMVSSNHVQPLCLTTRAL